MSAHANEEKGAAKEQDKGRLGISAGLAFGKEPAAVQATSERAGPYVTGSGSSGGADDSGTKEAAPGRTSPAALYQAHEAAYGGTEAPVQGKGGFVNPSSLGLSLFGAPPLSEKAPGEGRPAPADLSGGAVRWAKRTGVPPAEVREPPMAHPLSVASPLGIGVAGGAWNAPAESAPVQGKADEADKSRPAGEAAEAAWGGAWS